jgi:hypothetical protein
VQNILQGNLRVDVRHLFCHIARYFTNDSLFKQLDFGCPKLFSTVVLMIVILCGVFRTTVTVTIFVFRKIRLVSTFNNYE